MSGSSPRRRGTQCAHLPILRLHRFIPAQAGNTNHHIRRLVRRPVHPRAGGEHGLHHRRRARQLGSSPRRRGTQLGQLRPLVDRRFIPAQAGNTSVDTGSSAAVTVHPRAGGEHDRILKILQHPIGSSPRRRGTPVVVATDEDPGRFIPAQAGNTRHIDGFAAAGAVHPRAGGEHSSHN